MLIILSLGRAYKTITFGGNQKGVWNERHLCKDAQYASGPAQKAEKKAAS